MNYCDCGTVAVLKHDGVWYCDPCYDLMSEGLDEYGYEEFDLEIEEDEDE